MTNLKHSKQRNTKESIACIAWMQPIIIIWLHLIDAACCYTCGMFVSMVCVCLCVGHMVSPAEMAEPIGMPFGVGLMWNHDSLYTDGALPSVLWRHWLCGRKGIQPVNNWVVGCWRGYRSGARFRLAYGPADNHCHSLSLASVKSTLVFPFIQVVPDKGPLNMCVCVCVLMVHTRLLNTSGLGFK